MHVRGGLLNNFRIFETEGFQEDLKDILRSNFDKIYKKVKSFVYAQLMQQPYFGKNIKKLKGYKPDTWRYRIGDIRLFYQIDEKGKVVFMAAAHLRKDAY